MRNTLLCFSLVLASSAGGAATVEIDFTVPPSALVLPSTAKFGSDAYPIYVTGFTNLSGLIFANYNDYVVTSGPPGAQGLGLADDPSGDGEIWFDTSRKRTPGLGMDLSSVISKATGAEFLTNGLSDGEVWAVFASTGGLFDFEPLAKGTGNGWQNLPGWGHYSILYFISGGTERSGMSPTAGGWVLGGLRLQVPGTDAVPEPASWAMMIAGFGLAGVAARRRQTVQVAFA